MPIDDSNFKRMMLLIERDLMATAHLRGLLLAAETTHPQETPAVKPSVKRART